MASDLILDTADALSYTSWYPLVNVKVMKWKDPPFLIGKFKLYMAIFHSYVSFVITYQMVIICNYETRIQL